jgi:hypothetical protein
MDELSLLARIASLNARLDSLDPWLYVASIAVVVGVIFEFAIIFHEYRGEMHDWRRGNIRPPDKPSRKWLIIDIFGVALVCLGLAGEFTVEVRAGEIAADLRTDNGQLIAILDAKASAANERSTVLENSTQSLKTEADAERANAAGALQKAGQANATAEAEKLERVELQKQLAPRNMDDPSRANFAAKLKPFAVSLSGRKVMVSSYVGDAEGIVFSLEVIDVLTKAGINTDSEVGRIEPIGLVDMGIRIWGPTRDKDFLNNLGLGIYKAAKTPVNIEWNDKYPVDTVAVDAKPVAGLATIIRK